MRLFDLNLFGSTVHSAVGSITVTSANESSYADTFTDGTDLFSTLNLSQMLSDDPYGTTAPIPYLTRQLYLPSLSVGRLVETPDDIVGTLNRFVDPTVNGRLNPSTSLTTGYDFLYDSASSISRTSLSISASPGQTDGRAVTRAVSWALCGAGSAAMSPGRERTLTPERPTAFWMAVCRTRGICRELEINWQ